MTSLISLLRNRLVKFSLITVIIVPSMSLATPRCWIGVIDKINPPWMVITGEYHEEAIISIQETYADLAEGDWVIYWTRQHRIEKLISLGTQLEMKRLESQRELLTGSIHLSDFDNLSIDVD